MDNKQIVKYDFYIAISALILALAVAVQKLFFNDASLALLNFAISLIPTVYIIFSKKISKFKLVLIPILMILIRFITSLFSFLELETYDAIVQFCYDASFALSIFSIYSIVDKLKPDVNFSFKYITRVIIVISILFSVYNLIINADSYLYFTNIKYRYLINFSSFFSNKNLFGALLFFGLVSTDYELENSSGKKKLYLIKLFLLMNLILTLSRNCILAYLIFYFVLSFLKKKYKQILIPLFIVLIIFIFNMFGLRDLALTYLVRGDELSSGRTDIWKICLNYWENSPIIGYGELYISNIINGESGVTSMHSWFFKLLLNGGILNLICYIYIIFGVFKRSLYLLKVQEKNAKIIFSTLCAIVVYGVFEEINLFEFGLINIIFTTFFIIMPIVLFNKVKGEVNEEF